MASSPATDPTVRVRHVPPDEIEFVRECLVCEIRDRAPSETKLADEIAALPDDDPRLLRYAGRDNCLDMLTAEEFGEAMAAFSDRQINWSRDYTHRLASTALGSRCSSRS